MSPSSDSSSARSLYETQALGEAEMPSAADLFAQQNAHVGRYIVTAKLGAGGMGVVYGAYDPELDRKVALKFLLAGEGSKHAERRARLLREAQALAKFSHPEIVAIYDVGEHPVGVWLAMEFVEGRTLDVWAREARRSWREVLSVMCAAARGVAAAHAANVIHRDLKPSNIMVGNDGRVRVMDFGLTRAIGQTPALTLEEPAPELHPDRFTTPLTPRGSMLGTPAYMAPEQFIQGEITPAADQFAFCITLWELLFGERPFAGNSTRELGVEVLGGQLRHPPRRHGVPHWLLSVCERGLAHAPEHRWPSMQVLLGQLERGQSRERARTIAIGAGLLACLVATGEGWRRYEHAERVAACEAEGAQLREVWNDDSRANVYSTLVDSETSYATQTADRVLPWLDAHAEAWASARTRACMSATVDAQPGWDATVLDESRWCLDERRMEFEALVARLRDAEALDISRVIKAAADLRSTDACLDQELLARLPTPPTQEREQARDIRAELSRASALQATGDYKAALSVAEQALALAQALGWPPLVAMARARVGALLSETGKYEDAAKTLETAYFEAQACGAPEVAADSASSLVMVVGLRLGRHAWGEQWARHAHGVLESLPDPLHMREAGLLSYEASIELAEGSYERAKQLQERTLELMQRELGDHHPGLWSVLSNLALTLERMGEYEQARALHERALAVAEDVFGPWHPAVGAALNNYADNYRMVGDYAAAKPLIERSLALKEAAYGPEHPSVANSLGTLALILEGLGNYPEAQLLLERSLEIKKSAQGPGHPEVAVCLNNLAENHRKQGDYAGALQLHQQALAIKQAALGPDHTSVAASLTNLGDTHLLLGELEQAQQHYEQALAIFEQQLGREHPHLSYPLVGLAKLALARGRADEALVLAERALALREQANEPAIQQAEARFVVARALWDNGSRVRGLELAESARVDFEAAKARNDAAEVDAWLATHVLDR